jgi:recombination protein RecT
MMAFLKKSESQIAMALPKHLTPDRMMRLALTAFSTTPALRKCTPRSILSSVIVASQIGLEIGIAGQGYLIPYKDTATFVPGWQGLVGLLNNSGRATAWTGSVFEGDEFDFQLGSNPRCVHIPGPNYGDPEMITWVYACGKVNGSEQPVIEAWPIARVWKHRDRFNKVGQKHYSYEHPEMYARKVVLLQVLKYMPRSIELNNAIVASDAAEMGRATVVDGGVVVEVDEVTTSEQSGPIDPFKGKTAEVVVAAQTSQDARESETDARKKLFDDIRETTDDKEISFNQFDISARTLGEMGANESISQWQELPIQRLREIHAARVKISDAATQNLI